MKKCELCDGEAAIHCTSDQASLCWTCDFKVHGANFLVARHSRNLLCSVCQSPTPWSATGPNLGPTASFCAACSTGAAVLSAEERVEIDLFPASDGEIDSSDDEQDVKEEDDDNQVVPWGSSTPPPELSSSSGEDEEYYSDVRFKRNVSRPVDRSDGNDPVVRRGDQGRKCLTRGRKKEVTSSG